jgi:NhaA family Na+:H+ antiporter
MMTEQERGRAGAPEAWLPARRAIERVIRPLERFLHVEAASGLVLLAAAVVALVWANSPWSDTYEKFWHAPVTLGIGPYRSANSVHFWINDGLMVVFFFVVGLEIRREIHEGELSEPRRAALPAAAALGGMLVPAVIFLSFNRGLPSQPGWGVPMATDIAFAVGVMTLLGKRVPAALRVLLLALAIIDDIGAIIVIALFYSSGISIPGLLLALGGVAGVLLLQRLGARRALTYCLPGFVVWLGCLQAGIHPTIAGVILGLLTPARAWFGESGFLVTVRKAVEEFRGETERDGHRAEDLLGPLDHIDKARREAVAPVVRLQTTLHPWVAFLIMPLFALANAGVVLDGASLRAPEMRPVLLGVVLGLVIGKPLGILAMSYLAVRMRVALVPSGVSWKGIAVVGAVAGIGFTMAIFIAGLAFTSASRLNAAKFGVLVGSAVAASVGLGLGRLVLHLRGVDREDRHG